jgi:2-polyprenyl-3-methyl-5-hydroxy-6-metoxy-1,4-benzoquinol methylase
MKRFDKYERLGAYHYKWYEVNKFNYRTHVDKVLKYFRNCKGTILDIGCGDALISSKLCELGLHVTGVDTNARAIELGREKCRKYIENDRMILSEMSVFKINKARKFDYVLCNEVIEHIREPERCIKRIHVLMKKFSIITTPNLKHHSIGEYDYNMWDNNTIFELFKGYSDDITFLKKGKELHIKFIKRVNEA